MEKMIEDLLNRGYVYDTFREGETFHPYESFEADVDFWYGKYCEDVYAGVNDPDVGIVEYIAGKIDEDHPTESPEQFNSLMRWVREVLPKVEKNWSVSIREAQIGGAMQYANGEASGRALAGDLANKGIRDVTPGTNGRGQAEVDRTGVYVGVPMGPDKTAWANPTAAKNALSPAAAVRVDKFQKAYAAAPAKEKAAMQDWSPEKPDMSMNKNAQVVDNNTGTVMQTVAQPQAKSSILQKLGFKESLFEDILNVSKLNESCSNSEEAVANIKAEKKAAAAAKRAARESIDDNKSHLFESLIKENMETRIKQKGKTTTYITIKGSTKEELFYHIYEFFKSHQYCYTVDYSLEDKKLQKEYSEWRIKNSDRLFRKFASGRDYD